MSARSGALGLFASWFGLHVPVGRGFYAWTGFSLLFGKYGLESAVYYARTGRPWSPLQYFNPVLVSRLEGFGADQGVAALIQFVWTLPFVWVGVSMSVRRSADAGLSPWTGLLFFVPAVNYLLMLLLCVLPSSERGGWKGAPRAAVLDDRLTSALQGIAAGAAIATCMTVLSAYVFDFYGASLFFATPTVMGAVSAYLYNQGHPRPMGSTLGVAVLSVLLAGMVLLLFALEGVVCLAMALPLAAGAALLGGFVGRAVALEGMSSAYGAVLVLPVLVAGETLRAPGPQFEVVSSLEIEAPPERVWPKVVGFSELPPPESWLFRHGIAHPIRARIDGTGVGAVRSCEFSTGAFVEPITRWEPPVRLSFDVASQPRPMVEWSPYRDIAPPHLDGFLRAKRGEFRLVALPGGRTRLEGSTWYELDVLPRAYFGLYSDALIHRIHLRVMRHIRDLSQAP